MHASMNQILAGYAEERVPRYTSYPTAPHFAVTDTDAAHRQWLADLDPEDPVSLYLHVPFCREVCWYCACNMKLAARPEPVLAYAETLKREIDLVAEALPARMKVGQIHWGGGTPTAMPMETMASVMAALNARFDVLAGAEIAIELDPRTFAPDMAAHLADFGITRASLGVQEFDEKVQRAVNRIQPFDKVAETVAALRAAGISDINFDLMYGLPYQTLATLERSIALTLELRPQRIALFGYAHVPWVAKRQKQIDEAALPDPAARFAQAEHAAHLLVEAGYERVGLDHFALPQDDMAIASRNGTLRRNFQGYTTDAAQTLIGLGATSISQFPGSYVQNIAETGAWSRAVTEGRLPTAKTCVLSEEDKLRRAVIERLMCDLKVDLGDWTRRFGRAESHFDAELDACSPFIAQGLAQRAGRVLSVTEEGRPAMRVIAARFDAYLAARAGAAPKRHAVAV